LSSFFINKSFDRKISCTYFNLLVIYKGIGLKRKDKIPGQLCLAKLSVIFHCKSNLMEEKEMREFSWTGLFLVTSFCFFAFSIILELLDHDHPDFFIWIAGSSLFLGLINGISTLLTRTSGKRRRKLSS